MLSESEQRLIERLRKEAVDVKDCFARYSLQAIAFVTPILGLVVTLQTNNKLPLIGLASIPIILLMLTICRIGIHKYTTANRLNGFELHLHRLDSVPENMRSPWDAKARTMSWEEGMRAWRVVQTTMYETLYIPRRWLPHKLRCEESKKPPMWYELHKLVGNAVCCMRRYLRILMDNLYAVITRAYDAYLVWSKKKPPQKAEVLKKKETPKWYEPKTLIGGAVYYSGGYIRTLLKVLYAVIAFAYLCLVGAAVAAGRNDPPFNWWIVWGIRIITVIIGCWGLIAMRRLQSFVISLEDGIFSIHSCAVMWHAVAVAHVQALQNVFTRHGRLGLKGYHEELGRLACDLAAKPLELHKWIYRDDKAASPGHLAASAGL